MDSSFMKAFNPSLLEAKKVMGECFKFQGLSYQAVAIDDMVSGVRVIAGGVLADVTLTILVMRGIVSSSGLTENQVVTARGHTFRVLTITDDGSDSLTLNCGPAGVAMPGF